MKQSREFSLGSIANLITLVIGIALGFFLGNATRNVVRAQAIPAPTSEIVDVSPTMTAGSIGTNLLLAHEVDSDKLVVNGYDLLKLNQNILIYLQPVSERRTQIYKA